MSAFDEESAFQLRKLHIQLLRLYSPCSTLHLALPSGSSGYDSWCRECVHWIQQQMLLVAKHWVGALLGIPTTTSEVLVLHLSHGEALMLINLWSCFLGMLAWLIMSWSFWSKLYWTDIHVGDSLAGNIAVKWLTPSIPCPCLHARHISMASPLNIKLNAQYMHLGTWLRTFYWFNHCGVQLLILELASRCEGGSGQCVLVPESIH